VRFFSGTFLQLLECFAFLYRNCKNVVNFSRYATLIPNISEEIGTAASVPPQKIC
jgi:hypothetical protein